MGSYRLAAFATGVVYLTWRVVFTWQGANPVLFFLLLAAEAFGFLRLHMETSLLGPLRSPTRRPRKALRPNGDVIVIVTDEPDSEVRAAVLSARLIHGYKNLRIVDRDDRPDVAALAARLGLARVAGTAGADLGQLIDVALSQCTSLYTLLMPADLVVMPDILEVTAVAFEDDEVGVVTCRVENTNAMHAADFGGYGEHLRRDELMRSTLDDDGVLPWWPGMAVVRRSAVSQIDGMSRGRQGVGLATGVRLQAAGWRITDVPVVVGRRLAPWSDDRQLHRWARDLHERLSLLVDSEAPTRNPHSTRLSRRAYRLADLDVGRSIQRLVLIGVLFTVLYTSSLPLVADPIVLVGFWGAWMASSVLYRRAAQQPVGFVPWFSNDLRLLATDLVVAMRALPGKPLGIDLVDAAPGRLLRRVLLVGLEISLPLTLAAIATGTLRPTHGDFATFVALIAAGWLWAVAYVARSGLKVRQMRQNFRATDMLKVLDSETKLGILGVSPFGLDVVSDQTLRIGQKMRIAFALPQANGTFLRFECPTAVRRASFDRPHQLAYLRFAHLSDAEVDQITEYCAVVAGQHSLRDMPEIEPRLVAPIAGSIVQPRADQLEVAEPS